MPTCYFVRVYRLLFEFYLCIKSVFSSPIVVLLPSYCSVLMMELYVPKFKIDFATNCVTE